MFEKIRSLPRNVWILTLTSFLTDISSEMVVNVLPLFLATTLGVQTAFIGLIDGVAESTASLLKLYSGALSDRLGKRKALAVLGYGISALAKPLLYFTSTWGWALGARFGDRVGKGMRTAPRDALIAGSIDEKQRGLAFGLHRAGDTAGAFLGIALAAFIIWASQQGAVQLSRETFQTIVLVSLIPAALAVLILAFGAREVAAQGQAKTPLFSLQGLDGRFRMFLLAVGLFTLGNSSDSFIILRGSERGLSVLQAMGMLLTFNLVYSLLSGPLGALSDRLGRKKLMLAGWGLYTLVYLGLALAQTGAQVWALFGMYGLYYALSEGAAKAFIADLVPNERRGAAYGLYHAVIGLMALPASFLAGVLWQGLGGWLGLGPAAPFGFGAFMSGAALLVLARIKE